MCKVLKRTSSQAPSYASSKLLPTDSPTDLLTEVKCRATNVAKKTVTLVSDTNGFVCQACQQRTTFVSGVPFWDVTHFRGASIIWELMSGLSSETDLRQRDGLLVTDSGLLNQDTESRIRGGYKSTASVYSKVSANLVDHAHIEFVKKQTHI